MAFIFMGLLKNSIIIVNISALDYITVYFINVMSEKGES